MDTHAADISRRIDRRTAVELGELAATPEQASALLTSHIQLFFEQLAAVTHSMQPGYQRLMLTMEMFWENAFRHRLLYSHCNAVLRGHPLEDQVRQYGEPLRERVRNEMRACLIDPVEEPTRELLRRLRDISREETTQDQRLPALRQIQYEWLERICQQATDRSHDREPG